MFTPVYSCLPLFTHDYLSLPLFSRVYHCLLVHVSLYLPMFTCVYLCLHFLPMFTHVYLCVVLFTPEKFVISSSFCKSFVVRSEPCDRIEVVGGDEALSVGTREDLVESSTMTSEVSSNSGMSLRSSSSSSFSSS